MNTRLIFICLIYTIPFLLVVSKFSYANDNNPDTIYSQNEVNILTSKKIRHQNALVTNFMEPILSMDNANTAKPISSEQQSKPMLLSKNVMKEKDLLYLLTQEEEKTITDKAYPDLSSKWENGIVFVCWENPSDSDYIYRKLVQVAITNTWEHHSRLRFLGWNKCQISTTGIRILIKDVGPHVVALGNRMDGKKNGMVLNFTFEIWGSKCEPNKKHCIKIIAVHEFGHAIGFAHEHSRPDTPGECNRQISTIKGDTTLTPWDKNSVMNYCNPKYNNDGELSKFDIKAVQYIYGKPVK